MYDARKNMKTKLQWTVETTEEFNNTSNALVHVTALITFDDQSPGTLRTDASSSTIDVVL